MLSPSVRRTVFLSGSTHGDFYIEQFDTYPHGSVTPTGRRAEFAPTDNEVAVGAHHSTEPYIATQILRHIYLLGKTPSETKDFLAGVYTRVQKCESPIRRGFFGDYGDHNFRDLAHELLFNIDKWTTEAKSSSETEVSLARYKVLSAKPRYMEIVSYPDRLRFHYITTGESGEYEAFEDSIFEDKIIDIPNEYMADLLLALYEQTRSGVGRTSPDAIAVLIATALDPDQARSKLAEGRSDKH